MQHSKKPFGCCGTDLYLRILVRFGATSPLAEAYRRRRFIGLPQQQLPALIRWMRCGWDLAARLERTKKTPAMWLQPFRPSSRVIGDCFMAAIRSRPARTSV